MLNIQLFTNENMFCCPPVTKNRLAKWTLKNIYKFSKNMFGRGNGWNIAPFY